MRENSIVYFNVTFSSKARGATTLGKTTSSLTTLSTAI